MIPITEFSSILDLVQKFRDEKTCIEHLESIRWNGNVVSPFDPTSKVYVCKGNKYKCKNTNKYFNVRTGTIFEDTKIPLQKWFVALYLFSSHKKGISSHQLARDCNITQKTAWFVLHRLRYAFDHPAFKSQMKNTVEIDETYVGGKEINKHANKRTKESQGRSNKSKQAVLGIAERNGIVYAEKIKSSKIVHMHPIINEKVEKGATIMTDDYAAYQSLDLNYNHMVVNHSQKIYVTGDIHTNTIEGFWSQFKRGIVGIYHNVSFKHLQTYLDEFALRYNTRKGTEYNRFNLVLANMVGRLKYSELTGAQK